MLDVAFPVELVGTNTPASRNRSLALSTFAELDHAVLMTVGDMLGGARDDGDRYRNNETAAVACPVGLKELINEVAHHFQSEDGRLSVELRKKIEAVYAAIAGFNEPQIECDTSEAEVSFIWHNEEYSSTCSVVATPSLVKLVAFDQNDPSKNEVKFVETFTNFGVVHFLTKQDYTY